MPIKDPKKRREQNRKSCAKYHKSLKGKKVAKDYYETNKEQILKRSKNNYEKTKVKKVKQAKKHRQAHRAQYCEMRKKYYHNNPEYFRKWTKDHKEQLKEYSKNHYQTHRKQRIKQTKKWQKEHPKEWAKIQATNKAKRRKLGHNYLNEWFEGADGHHIDFECVVWIPHELHESIRHCVWTGRNMELINDKAFEWLGFN
jgi:hypothetical protein